MERLLANAKTLTSAPLPSSRRVRDICAEDMLCAARLIARSLGGKARLERVKHPDTDMIRRVNTAPSLSGWKVRRAGELRLNLTHFGRKAVAEINTAIMLGGKQVYRDISIIEIDLRNNRGGNLDRMLRAASLFLGAIPDAVRLTGVKGSRLISVPPHAKPLSFTAIRVLIGRHTASSAEIFTALLRVHAGARVIGARSYGKNYLHRILAVNHDWRLLVPAERVVVPGAELSGGIVPDDVIDTPF